MLLFYFLTILFFKDATIVNCAATSISTSTQESEQPFSQIAENNGYYVKAIDIWLEDKERYQHTDGTPKRLLNAFILYRNAYYDAIKEHLNTRYSHEVSSYSGKSWKIETCRIKDYYHYLAEIAKNKHKEMFPFYRNFSKRSSHVLPDIDTEDTEDADAPHENVPLEEWYNLS
jgi:hypothetical protein